VTTIQNTVHELQELWAILFPSIPGPNEQQLAIWLTRYGNDTVREGLAQAAIKFRKLNGQMSEEYILRFTSSVMNRLQGSGTREIPGAPLGQQYEGKFTGERRIEK
jgi:hypothetical protein